MTREEAKTVFLNRGYIEVEGGSIYDPDKWREACVVISEWLEQQPKMDKIMMRDATPEEQKSVNDYIKSISKPTGVEFDIDIPKKVESYRKLLKHPVVKHIMDMDEEQEQIDFVQPHKKVPVTLIVESNDCISRQDAINSNCYNCSIKTNGGKCSKCDAVKAIEKLPSVISQPCEVEAAKLQQAYNKGFENCRQMVLDIIAKSSKSNWIDNSVLFKRVNDLPPVTPQPKTVLYSGDGYANGYMVYDMAECPNCGYEYEDGDKDWGLSFCPNCGQKLIWESEE